MKDGGDRGGIIEEKKELAIAKNEMKWKKK